MTTIINLASTIFFLFTFHPVSSLADLSSVSVITPCKAKDFLSPFPDLTLELVIKGLSQPVQVTHAGDNSRRLFITEQGGIIRVFKNGKLIPKPFLDIRNRVISGGEMGLLSTAFHPNFKKNGRFFVNYTSSKGGLHTVISEFNVRQNLDSANKNSEQAILTISQPFSNHNGGHIAFGADGYLYIGMGDGGAGNDPFGHGQNLSTLLGTILRINVDRIESGKKYSVPVDNPFRSQPNIRPEIWAYGLRNPWRFSFDPLTSTLYVGDVGQNSREEIDIVERGKNYGWNIMEGSICTPSVNKNCDTTSLTLPITEYKRDKGTTVIGGSIYRGSKIPSLCGTYLYGDFGSGKIWGLQYNDRKVVKKKLLLKTKFPISSFGVDEDYEIYLVNYGGSIYKIIK